MRGILLIGILLMGGFGYGEEEVISGANLEIVAEAVKAGQQGDISRLIELHGGGVSFDQRDPVSGLTAPEAARLAGRAETVEWFKGRGFGGGSDALPRLDRIADQRLRARMDAEGPGLAVLVARGEEVLFREGYGMANLRTGERMGAESVFRVGSITKPFVAAAVLLLAEEGRLQLGNKLSQYFPDFPRGEQITLHQLLTHTSGLPSFTSKVEFEERVLGETEAEEVIAWFQEDGFEFDPGAGWVYSNSGYFLLGEVIRKVTGTGWGEFLDRRIFRPLKMRRTGVHGGVRLDGEAVGYAWDEEAGKSGEAADWNLAWMGGAGAMYSTVDDLLRWSRGVFGGVVLSKESLRLAHGPVRIEGGVHLDTGAGWYGYGWRMETYRGRKVISHDGGLAGFQGFLGYFPEDEVTVVVLSNSSPAVPGTSPEEIWKELADLFLWKELEPKPSFRRGMEPEVDSLGEYAGAFDFKLLGTLRVRADGANLRAQMSVQQEVVLESQGADTFYYPEGDAEFRFLRDEETGGFSAVDVVQAGFRIHGERYEEPEEVVVRGEVLRRYVGDYDLGTNLLEIRVGADGGLVANVKGGKAAAIYASGEGSFFWKAERAQVEFERDAESGKVVGLRYTRGGRGEGRLARKVEPVGY